VALRSGVPRFRGSRFSADGPPGVGLTPAPPEPADAVPPGLPGGVFRLPATLGDVGRECGQVACGVLIPVEDEPAGGTGVGALGQGELGFHRAATRAGLAGGEPAVGNDQPPAVPGGLVGQLSPYLAHADIGHRAGQPPVGQHPRHVEVFDHDRAVGGGQAAGELVYPVTPPVGHLRVRTAERGFSLVPAGGCLTSVTRGGSGALAAGEFLAESAEFTQCRAVVPGIGDDLTGGQHREILHPRSTPTTAAGRAGTRSARSISQVKDTSHRPPSYRTVAAMIRPVPRSRCRASLRVDSLVRIVPSRGSVT
jgi:hypothetical protein